MFEMRHPDIVLVTPFAGSNQYHFDFSLDAAYEDLSLGYLASSLSRAGYCVTVIDGPAMGLGREQILYRVRESTPTVLGLSLINETLCECEEIAATVKAELPDTYIVVGGHLPTNAPMDVLNGCQAFDAAVLGYGEDTIVEICQRLMSGQGLEAVRGVAYRTDGGIVTNEPRSLRIDIDGIPFPSRYALSHKILQGRLPVARMITSRGCPHRCTYCTTPAFLDAHGAIGTDRWQPRSPENVVDELERLVRDHGVKVVVFCDDEFLAKARGGTERALQIARLIQDRGLSVRFWSMFRVDDLDPADDCVIGELKAAGLWGVFLGVETGSDHQLSSYAKGTSVEQNRLALELLRKHNILVEIGSMTFYPEVTYDELADTTDFLEQTREASLFWHFTSRLAIYPGDHRLIEHLERRGLLLPSFSYRNEYAYRFADPSIGILSGILADTGTRFHRFDTIVWNAKRVLQILTDSLTRNATVRHSAECRDLGGVRSELIRIDDEIGAANCRCFRNLMCSSADGASGTKLRAILKEHALRLERLSSAVRAPLAAVEQRRSHWEGSLNGEILDRLYLSDLWANWESQVSSLHNDSML